jgi:pimeloyl-ACP methyl ester carboxylesterase
VADALEAARELFNVAPWVGSVDLGDGNGPQEFTITGDDLVGGVFSALYDTATIPRLPGIIQELANGDASAIPALVQLASGTVTGAADAVQLSVDDESRENPGRLTLLAALGGPSCQEWGVEPTRADFNTPVESDIPALVLAGEFDPVTPSDGTAAAAERLTNADYFFFPGFGHGITGNDVCATAIEIQFLTDPNAPIISGCLPPPAS